MRRDCFRPVAWIALAAFVVAYGAGPCRLHAHAGCHEESAAGCESPQAADGWTTPHEDDDGCAPACPSPGACATCSVAKVPGTASASDWSLTADAAGGTGVEPPLLLLPAHDRELMRPPR